MNWETLLCIGDSITLGSRSYLGYPEYCANYLSTHTRKDWNAYNLSVSGYTTIDIVRLLDSKWGDLKLLKPEMITIMAGTNDLKIKTSLDDFRIAYSQLVLKSKLLIGSANIILIKIPQLHEGVMLPYHLGMNAQVDAYNAVIEDIALTNNLFLFQMKQDTNHFFDGVHLNGEGSQAWGHQLGDFILKLRKA